MTVTFKGMKSLTFSVAVVGFSVMLLTRIFPVVPLVISYTT